MACGVIYASSLVFPSCGCHSPAALMLSRNLLASCPTAVLPNGLSGFPVVAAVSQPTHAVSACHGGKCGKWRGRSRTQCVRQPTCLPGSVGPTPPPACSTRLQHQKEEKSKEDAETEGSGGKEELGASGPCKLISESHIWKEVFTSMHEEVSAEGTRQRCSFCYSASKRIMGF